jgi:uncharacterized protein YerC
MAQVSRRFLRPDIQTRIYSLFLSSIVLTGSQAAAASFIEDLLTPTEKIVLSKRFSIAFMLLEGYDYDTIGSTLKVSKPTIGNVSVLLKARGNGVRSVIQKIKRTESLKSIWHEIEEAVAEVLTKSRGYQSKSGRILAQDLHRSHQKPY